jgi:dTDP-glucose pyrophosphorylase
VSLRWGIIPAAGRGTRIQPLAFSKELLPVGTRQDGATERPRAVTEYLIERMIANGVNRVCFVISPEHWPGPHLLRGATKSSRLVRRAIQRPAICCSER